MNERFHLSKNSYCTTTHPPPANLYSTVDHARATRARTQHVRAVGHQQDSEGRSSTNRRRSKLSMNQRVSMTLRRCPLTIRCLFIRLFVFVSLLIIGATSSLVCFSQYLSYSSFSFSEVIASTFFINIISNAYYCFIIILSFLVPPFPFFSHSFSCFLIFLLIFPFLHFPRGPNKQICSIHTP